MIYYKYILYKINFYCNLYNNILNVVFPILKYDPHNIYYGDK